MSHLLSRAARRTMATATFGTTLFLHASTANAATLPYYVYTTLFVSNPACQYDQYQNFISADVWGYGGSTDCNAMTSTNSPNDEEDNPAFAFCGTTEPTMVQVFAGYLNSRGNFDGDGISDTEQWGTCATAYVNPSYYSNGDVCDGFIEAVGCGITPP